MVSEGDRWGLPLCRHIPPKTMLTSTEIWPILALENGIRNLLKSGMSNVEELSKISLRGMIRQ